MPPEVRAEFDLLLARRLQVERLGDFIPAISPHLPPPRHVRFLSEKIEQARLQRRCMTLAWPPRHAKTTTLRHAFAWWLKYDPADTCAYFTYNDTKGRSKSRRARELALRSGVQLVGDSKNLAEWRTTAGGGLLAGGAGGGLTGEGVSGLFVVDDPYKNRQEADSEIRRERIWDWFTEVVLTRLEKASVVVIQTRWHEDDLIGRIMADPEFDDYEHVNLPALAEEDDPLDRVLGEALWPDRYPREWLEDLARKIGDWSFAALYQGQPRPKGGRVFQEAARFDLATFDITGCRGCIAVDPAATAKTRADHSAIVVMAIKGYGAQSVAYILDVIRVQVEIPQLVRMLRDVQSRRRLLIVAESVGGFKAVPQSLRDQDPNLGIVEVTPSTDKFIRSQPLAAAWNAGRVLVPIDAPWADEYLAEFRRFTGMGDAEDDQVDATAHGWTALYKDAEPRPLGFRRGNELPFA